MLSLTEIEEILLEKDVENKVFKVSNEELILDINTNFECLISDLNCINKIQKEEGIIDLKESFFNTDLFCQYEFAQFYMIEGYVRIID